MEPFNFTKKLDLELTKEGAWTVPSPTPPPPPAQALYSQHLKVICKLPVGPLRFARDKHLGLLDQFVSYEENEVL